MAGSGQIELHRSNSMERLVGTLAETLDTHPLPPTQKEWIVVQGAAMQRWLSIQLSEKLGVLANARFPFPRYLVNQAVLSVLMRHTNTVSGLDPGPLFWAIAQEFEEHVDDPELREIRNYLTGGQDGGNQDPRRRFELANRVARMFDRYTVYRPDLLESWKQGEESGWQPAMWRSLSKKFGEGHGGAMLSEFLNKVGNDTGPIEGLPKRVCLFGISALPPLYMQAIAAIATRVEIHLFVLSPSQQYWADIKRNKGRVVPEGELEEGNPLLLSLGRLSGDFQQVLEEYAGYNETGVDLYRRPDPDSSGKMLATVQEDILELRHRRKLPASDATASHDDQNPPPLPLRPDDESIAIHCCHSPMRELELLHDQLVAKLEADPSLDARDIVVMAPDIEEYAPLIEAVFASTKDDRPRIPYRIADQTDRATYPVLQAYARVLGVLSGRLPAPDILDLLNLDVIRGRFKINEDELPQVTKWIVDSGIRWGQDKEHRETVGQPDFAENTWRFGLDRLLLGYALESRDRETYNEVLAYDDLEGTSADLLGRLLNFCDAIFDARKAVSAPQSTSDWGTTLLRILGATVVSTEENASEHQLVRESIATMEEDSGAGKFAGTVPYDSICTHLETSWQQSNSTRGFLSGGITFCQLMPMRSIPFRMVCLLGMSDGVFPRATQPLGFDRIASDPRLGDRTTRDDDRYLFLEAIMAAKDALFISYVGRSIKNNAKLPPSVLVGELMDVLEDSFIVENGKLREELITVHPLQPFSPRYYEKTSDPKLFSYSAAYCSGANSLAEAQLEPRRFLAGPLTKDDTGERIVSLDDLANFFMHPAKYLLEKRLRLFLDENNTSVLDREPIELRGLDLWRVGDSLLQQGLQGSNLDDLYESYRASGRLPLGTVGKARFEDLVSAVSAICKSYAGRMEWAAGEALDDISLDLEIAGCRLVGSLSGIWRRTGRVEIAYKSTLGKSQIGHWIRHLAFLAAAPDDLLDIGRVTTVIGYSNAQRRPMSVSFTDPAIFGDSGAYSDPDAPNTSACKRQLRQLIELYWAGQVAPLPFFPKTAFKFMEGFDLDYPSPDHPNFSCALEQARRFFFDKPYVGEAESADPYIAQVFGDDACLETDYQPFEQVPEGYASFPKICDLLVAPLVRCRVESLS